jgi:hypothetical protein
VRSRRAQPGRPHRRRVAAHPAVLEFGQLEYLAKRWLRVGWVVDREICLQTLTDSWCHFFDPDPNGPYWYRGGWNPKALAAFAPSALICLVLALVPTFAAIAPFSWFVGVVLGGALYLVIARRTRLVAAQAPVASGDAEDLPHDRR